MSTPEQTAISGRLVHSWTEEYTQPKVFLDVPIPARSRLYGLEPQALGTMFQESLTSYLNRLGWKHWVSPRALVAQEFLPHLTSEYPQYYLAAFSRGTAMQVNGTGDVAQEWSAILEQLTGQSSLHLLILRWWIGNFSARGHLRETPAWCPICYAEWLKKSLPLYQPLLWMIRVVTICPQHKRPLEVHCPHCQKYQSVIALRTHPGHCTQCNSWLGTMPDIGSNVEIDEKTLHWQSWVTHVLEELLLASRASGVLSWEPFFASLAICIEKRGVGSKLSDLTGLDRTMFYLWLGRMRRTFTYTPTLEAIFAFCYACNMTPLQFMTTPDMLLQAIQSGHPVHEPRPHRSKRKVDRERCRELLEAVLDGREELTGVSQLAKRLGYHPSLLRYYFLQECKEIIQRNQEYEKQRRQEREASICEEVRQAVLILHDQGIFPSHRKVRTLLSNPNLMRMPEASAAWHAARRELGLEQ